MEVPDDGDLGREAQVGSESALEIESLQAKDESVAKADQVEAGAERRFDDAGPGCHEIPTHSRLGRVQELLEERVLDRLAEDEISRGELETQRRRAPDHPVFAEIIETKEPDRLDRLEGRDHVLDARQRRFRLVVELRVLDELADRSFSLVDLLQGPLEQPEGILDLVEDNPDLLDVRFDGRTVFLGDAFDGGDRLIQALRQRVDALVEVPGGPGDAVDAGAEGLLVLDHEILKVVGEFVEVLQCRPRFRSGSPRP